MDTVVTLFRISTLVNTQTKRGRIELKLYTFNASE